MKYGPFFAATLRAGAYFPDLVVACRSQTPGMHHSSFLDLVKIGSRRHRLDSANRPYVGRLLFESRSQSPVQNSLKHRMQEEQTEVKQCGP